MRYEMQATAQLLNFNRAVALERVGGDEELLREVAELYLAEYADLVGQIDAAVRTGDATTLQRSAHTLKGSLGTLGGELAAAQALELEMMGRGHDMARAQAALRELHLTLDRFHHELRTAFA